MTYVNHRDIEGTKDARSQKLTSAVDPGSRKTDLRSRQQINQLGVGFWQGQGA